MKRRARLSVCFRRLLWLSMRFLLVGAMFALAAGPIGESGAPAATSTWEGGDGDWDEDAEWHPDGAPDATDVDVAIDDGQTGTDSTVTLNMNAKVQSLTIDDGDTFDMDDNRTFNVYGGGVTNNGTWNINCIAGNGQTYVYLRGTQTLGGTGTLDLGPDRDGYLATSADADVITHGANHTIRGAGRILGAVTASGGMINNGTIIAEGDADQSLRIWAGTPGFTNAGTLKATGAGGLELRGSTFTNTGQTIEVLAGSRLDLFNMTLDGGEISGAGEILPGTGVNFDGVTIAFGSTVGQTANTNIGILNGLTNDGTWNLNGGNGVATTLTVHGSHTLGGTGEVVLSAHNRNRIRPSAAGEVITHGTDHTIRGGGRLLDNTGGMTNNGTILAEGSQQLVINPGDTDPNDVFTNAGTLRAVGSGGLKLQGGDVVNTGHTIEVADGSLLELHNCVLKGGTLSAVGSHTGAIHVTENCDFGTVTVDTDTTVDQDNGVNVDIVSGLTNNGTWNLNSTGGNTGLFFHGTQMLDGTGEIVMSDNADNAVRGGSTGDVLKHGANHTIRGAGHVLWGNGSMVNQGAIIADAATTDMRIDPGAPDTFTNEGLVEVAASSRLVSTGTLAQTAGTTRVDGELSVATLDIQGGVLTGTGTITGQTDMAGTFAPGASVGTLTFELLEILGGASYDFEIQGTLSDLIDVTNVFVMDPDGPYSIDVICSGGLACMGEHDFFTWDGDDPIEFKDWALLYDNTTITFSTGYDGDWSYDENMNRMFVEITQTPEPATLALLALGGFGLFVRRRKV